jgi:hypothetical protein
VKAVWVGVSPPSNSRGPISPRTGLGTNVAAASISLSLPATGTECPLREAPVIGNSTVDVLDRVLDKGLSIAGDIRISITEVELRTMRIRMILCSIAKAQRSGATGGSTIVISFRSRAGDSGADDVRKQIEDLARKVALLSAGTDIAPAAGSPPIRRSAASIGP